MGFRSNIAQFAGSILAWGLRHIAHRPAGTYPGKLALDIDPFVVRDLRRKLREGCVVVAGTNGKTTVTNLLADAVEKSGRSVLCNRTGANLKSGIASALLQGRPSDWGIIECDELWLEKALPDLQPNWLLLLNLFRDQLDRCGEIDTIQATIIDALEASPSTGLIYNADDPLCQYVAQKAAEMRVSQGRELKTISFGLGESMHLAQNAVADATMCQVCSHMFDYEYRQYGQLGAYACSHCGFARPRPDFDAESIVLSPVGISFAVDGVNLHAGFSGSYNVYNLLAVYACAAMIGCSAADVQAVVDSFDPKNGRLQRYVIDGRPVLLNLAKNPTGFNQNLRIVAADDGPHAVAFFINDWAVDGHDISWIWDIDFEELVASPDVCVFVGGRRRNDLQVRLKYAGVEARLIDGMDEVFNNLALMTSKGEFLPDAAVYAISNYSALPDVHNDLNALAGGN